MLPNLQKWKSRYPKVMRTLPKVTQLVWEGLAVDKPRPSDFRAHCTAAHT